MKHLLLTTIAAVLLVGCGESQPPEPPTAEAPAISIHDAAEKGDIEAVKQYLAAGTDVKAMDRRGRTPLHFAAKRGQKELVELLIANGADVNARRSKYGGGYTPLHYAGWNMEIAALLIANGADVNVKMNGKTILDSARLRNPKFADLLRKHGGKYGSIHTATAGGDTEAVKEFLAAGADVNAKGGIGGTPLDYAVALKRIETADLLREHGGKYGSIHTAAAAGDTDVIKEVLAAGADVNAKDISGETLLDWAIKYKQTETAELLRKHGGKTGEELKAEGK